MKKHMILAMSAVAAGIFAGGCAVCTDPIDSSCIEVSHPGNKQVLPDGVAFQAPVVKASPDYIVPRFRVGNVRVTAIGTGNSLEEATNDAIINFKKKAQCDYIVAVNTDVSQHTHPTLRIHALTNYSVSLTGLPVFLDRLEVVDGKAEAEAAAAKTAEAANSAEATATGTPVPVCSQKAGLIKLSDISVQINAKGESADDAALIYPVVK
ncbi:MAG: hypothetical protein E7050_01290 [Lentisphaerae bacterium]|nr:hypothetical protein [Lentisphaerota bacterium]